MSDTIVDMPKVTQMLDAGWIVQIQKCDLGSYAVRAKHLANPSLFSRAIDRLRGKWPGGPKQYDEDEPDNDGDSLITDDFTPQQALTRMAYKVHGEII